MKGRSVGKVFTFCHPLRGDLINYLIPFYTSCVYVLPVAFENEFIRSPPASSFPFCFLASLSLSLPIHKNKYESEKKTRKNFAYHQIFVECRVSLYISRHNCTFQFELKIWIYFSSLSHLPYLSLYPSSCRAKFVPDFLPTEEVAPARSTLPTVSSDGGEAKTDEKFAPPTPEEAERIISNLLPR